MVVLVKNPEIVRLISKKYHSFFLFCANGKTKNEMKSNQKLNFQSWLVLPYFSFNLGRISLVQAETPPLFPEGPCTIISRHGINTVIAIVGNENVILSIAFAIFIIFRFIFSIDLCLAYHSHSPDGLLFFSLLSLLVKRFYILFL